MTLEETLEFQNRTMIAFDLALGSGALLAPDFTLKLLGHDKPSDDAREIFRRCGPIWLTFAAAHTVAATRGRKQDWWGVAWLRGTELFTDIVWSRSAAIPQPRSKAALYFAGAANAAMAAGYAWLASRR